MDMSSGHSLNRSVDVICVMDTRTPEQRRRIMKAVKSKNTSPEVLVRKILHGLGYRFRLHRKDLPGNPDIVLPSRKKAIFVHGCFWHLHDCPKGRPPKSRQEYWLPKLEKNAERDRIKEEQIRKAGWKVLVVWQCELKDIASATKRLQDFVENA